MIIEVVKEFSFDAAHFLPNYEGKCAETHGHRWVLEVGFAGEVDPKTGMVIDFVDIKSMVNGLIIDKLDHKLLNEIEAPQQFEQQVLFESTKPEFPYRNPTAENMVEWMVRVLKARTPSRDGLRLTLLRLYESPTSYAEWRDGEGFQLERGECGC